MLATIEFIASVIEISTFVYSRGRWLLHKIQKKKVPKSIGGVDKDFKLQAEYYSLTKDVGVWRKFKLGRENFIENKRLVHDKTKLIEFYPGLSDRLLTDKRIGQMPYEIITLKTKEFGFEIQDTKFIIRPALKGSYDAIYKNLVDHYRKVGIQYVPTSLARVCNLNKNIFTVEQTDYTQVASTNLIADLDIEAVLKKNILSENIQGLCNSLREYDLSLSDTPQCYPTFEKSSFANPIGVAGLAITADDRLILTHRSRGVSTYAYKLGPSSSGYITWHDVQSKIGDSFNSLLIAGLQREITEELYLDLSHDISVLHPLGFFRELYRAGMPQAFYCFRINLTADELVSRIRDAQDFPEFVGVLSIPVNLQRIPKIILTLVRAQKIGVLNIGLEAQGLLTALSLSGEDFLFPQSGR